MNSGLRRVLGACVAVWVVCALGMLIIALLGCVTPQSRTVDAGGCLVDATSYYIASHSAERLAHLLRNDVLIYERHDGTAHAVHVFEFRGVAWCRDASGSRLIAPRGWTALDVARACEPGQIASAFFLGRSRWEPPSDFIIQNLRSSTFDVRRSEFLDVRRSRFTA